MTRRRSCSDISIVIMYFSIASRATESILWLIIIGIRLLPSPLADYDYGAIRRSSPTP